MRRNTFIIAVVVVLLSAAGPAAAQCGAPAGDWGFGPTAGAHGNGTVAVFGSGRMLNLARIADPSAPTLETSLAMPGLVERVVVDGSWAYVAAYSGGVVVVDISTPAHPEIAATVETEGEVRSITLVGDLVYAVDGFEGLIILDVSDPAAPERMSVLDLDGFFHDTAVHDTLAFVADYGIGLRVIDVADSSNPVLVASIEGLEHSARVAVTDDGTTVYLTNYFDGFHVIDVSDHLAPEIVGFVENPSYTIDLEIDGDYLYAANRGYGMRVFDLADPLAPVEVRQVDRDGENRSVTIHENLAYLGNSTAGLRLVDISDPPEAEEVGSIDGTPESEGVSIQGGLAYVSGGNQQIILDFSRPDLPEAISTTDVTGNVRRAVVAGRYVYAAADYGGLRVIDIDDPEQPEEIGFLDTFDAYDVVKDGDLLYLSTYDDGIRVVDASVPSSPTLIGTLDGFRVGFINHDGGVIYAPEWGVGVRLVDVTDPTSPLEIEMLEMMRPMGRPAISGDLLFTADSSSGVRIFDNTDPRAPVALATITQARHCFGMAAMGDLLFAATTYGGAYVFDVSDPASPVELVNNPLATNREGEVGSEGSLALVAEVNGGVEVFDLGACFNETPTADFTWRPANPEAGRFVQLTDTSIGSIDTRQWNFGDGASSGKRNPTHVWTEAGDYDVRLTVSGAHGSHVVTHTVTVDPRTGGVPPITDPGAFSYVLAAAAHARGLVSTSWVTDAVFHNPGSEPAQGHVWFMKQGRDNTGAEGVAVAVGAGASVLIEDIVLSMFGESATSGSILVGSDQPLVVTSRTYNDAESGTYGQFIPGRETRTAVGPAESVTLIQLTRSSTFRTNLGVANPTDRSLVVDVSLRDAQGLEINSRILTVPPFGFLQQTDILGVDADDAYAVVSSSTDGAAYFPYASVVDNRTGDPMMVEPIDPSNAIVIAASAHVAGLEDTDWRTDLEVCNFGLTRVRFELDLLKTEQNNSSPSSFNMSLDGMSCDRVEDVLETAFSYEGTAGLGVKTKSGELVVSSRTFNNTDGGTYGQFLPGTPDGAALVVGQEGRIVQLTQSTGSSSGFRTNIGFVNRASTPTTIMVDLRHATGTSLGTLTLDLQPFEHRQINRVYRQVTAGAVENGVAVVSTSSAGGSFVAYASVVDNASGDPVYIPATVVGD